MASTTARPTGPYLSVASLVAAMAFIALGNGLMASYVPVRLDQAGLDQRSVGLVVTAYAAGMLLGCLLSGYLVRRAGHVRAFMTLAAMGTISALLLALHTDLGSWSGLRLVSGFCTTGMFMVAQSWLNAVTASGWRGRVMALFYVCYTVGLAGGALLMGRVDIAGSSALMLMAGLYAAAVIPVGMTRLRQPAPPERISVRPLSVYRISPVGLVGAFVSGGLGMTMMGVGPMYGTAIGLEPAAIALLIAALQGGNLVIQWPLGALSDRIDRRLVILAAGGGISVVSLAIALGDDALAGGLFWLLLGCFAVWGGLAESLYTISTAHTNDHTDPDDHVMVSSTILIVWATGATVGPAVATVALELAGPPGLWAFFLAEAVLFTLFVLWRRGRRAEPSESDQESFQGWPAATPPIPEWNPNAPDEGGEAKAPSPGPDRS
ncbi:MFS transporter [Marivibrio halodurans]|uniref:MFS transporter n=1 Tax=Marivibrio halodurans TaxID=2039722 RepID=A0A8J7SPX0_9PROT|nr:MFS transporter [Marivibrio halodurans]MBP5858621.1 MFS transporter [Marivibrio halodurans]